MCTVARLFYCACCHKQVIVCSHCDRGQIYCGDGCKEFMRLTSRHAANARYQQTRQGKHKHAIRQRQYRQRKHHATKKVTYQGSRINNPHAVMFSSPSEVKKSMLDLKLGELYCHFCKKLVPNYLRTIFLTPMNRHHSRWMTKAT